MRFGRTVSDGLSCRAGETRLGFLRSGALKRRSNLRPRHAPPLAYSENAILLRKLTKRLVASEFFASGSPLLALHNAIFKGGIA